MPAKNNTSLISSTDRSAGGPQPDKATPTGSAPTGSSTTFTGTADLAKITGGGSDGSLTIVNGIVTAYTAPT